MKYNIQIVVVLFSFLASCLLYGQATGLPKVRTYKPIEVNDSRTHYIYRENVFRMNQHLIRQNRALQHRNTELQNKQRIQQLTQIKIEQKKQQIYKHLQEEKEEQRATVVNANKPVSNLKEKKYYHQAFAYLRDMLEGKQETSVKKAVFAVENAYFEDKLSYKDYNDGIQNYVKACKYLMDTQGKSPFEALNTLFADTIQKVIDGKVMNLYKPFTYDFDDPFGKEEWANMFVSKLLYTKKGQCHSMPLLYKIIGNEIGLTSHISFSPSHSFIKYQDNKGRWVNFETTNGHKISETWLAASGHIKREAVRNRIFLDTMSLQQTINYCLFDLASGYAEKFGHDDFVGLCISLGLNQEKNKAFWLALQANYSREIIYKLADEAGYPNYQELNKYPKLNYQVNNLLLLQEHIDKLGYTEMTPDNYTTWLQSYKPSKKNTNN